MIGFIKCWIFNKHDPEPFNTLANRNYKIIFDAHGWTNFGVCNRCNKLIRSVNNESWRRNGK